MPHLCLIGGGVRRSCSNFSLYAWQHGVLAGILFVRLLIVLRIAAADAHARMVVAAQRNEQTEDGLGRTGTGRTGGVYAVTTACLCNIPTHCTCAAPRGRFFTCNLLVPAAHTTAYAGLPAHACHLGSTVYLRSSHHTCRFCLHAFCLPCGFTMPLPLGISRTPTTTAPACHTSRLPVLVPAFILLPLPPPYPIPPGAGPPYRLPPRTHLPGFCTHTVYHLPLHLLVPFTAHLLRMPHTAYAAHFAGFTAYPVLRIFLHTPHTFPFTTRAIFSRHHPCLDSSAYLHIRFVVISTPGFVLLPFSPHTYTHTPIPACTGLPYTHLIGLLLRPTTTTLLLHYASATTGCRTYCACLPAFYLPCHPFTTCMLFGMGGQDHRTHLHTPISSAPGFVCVYSCLVTRQGISISTAYLILPLPAHSACHLPASPSPPTLGLLTFYIPAATCAFLHTTAHTCLLHTPHYSTCRTNCVLFDSIPLYHTPTWFHGPLLQTRRLFTGCPSTTCMELTPAAFCYTDLISTPPPLLFLGFTTTTCHCRGGSYHLHTIYGSAHCLLGLPHTNLLSFLLSCTPPLHLPVRFLHRTVTHIGLCVRLPTSFFTFPASPPPVPRVLRLHFCASTPPFWIHTVLSG